MTKTVAQLLQPKDILLDVHCADKADLFQKIGRHLEWVHNLPQGSVAAALAYREQIGSTALGQGIAIPHARLKELNHIQLAYLRLNPAIDFDAPDGVPVTHVMVILVPKMATEEHLRVLAETSEFFSNARFREQLPQCSHAGEVKQLFDMWPRPLF
jgi:PTS system nitrogen regulatory IIA component